VGPIIAIAIAAVAIGVGTGVISLGGEDVQRVGQGTVQTEPVEDADAIAARFAPVLRQHSTERFLPIDRGAYVSASVLETAVKGGATQILKRFLGVTDLPESLSGCPIAGCRFFLDIPGLSESSPVRKYVAVQARILRNRTPAVYWNVTRYKETGDLAVQYWFLYLFNNFLNRHESDWEQITVELDSDRRPLAAYYSSHEGGQTRDWNDVRKIGEHPIVYAAGGSHANYFTSGRHPVRLMQCSRIAGRRTCVNASAANDAADGCGPTLDPDGIGELGMSMMVEERCSSRATSGTRRYHLRRLGPPVFIGSWGPSNTIGVGLIPIGEGGFADPQARTAWRDPLSQLATAS
jgi:hypothetical protein